MSGIPYVIENVGTSKERAYDLYSRLLKDRIVFIGRDFTDDLANAVVAQLLFLESDDPNKDITIYINSRGGYISACLAIYDTLNYIKPDVSTVCVGEAASAAAFTLAAGTPGKRYALKNSRIMLHKVSAGTQGQIEDMNIALREFNRHNEMMLQELSNITGHSVKKLEKDMDRDYYMSPAEAQEYGVIDHVLTKRS